MNLAPMPCVMSSDMKNPRLLGDKIIILFIYLFSLLSICHFCGFQQELYVISGQINQDYCRNSI